MKRKQILIIITVFILSFNLFGADKINQLKKKILESSDKKKTKLYNQLSIEYLKKNNLKKYYEVSKIVLANAIKNKQLELQIDALLHLSHYYYKKKKIERGKLYLKEALKLAKLLKNTNILIKVWEEYFNIYGSSSTKEDITYSLTISKNLVHLYKLKNNLKNQVLFTHIQGTLYSLLKDNKMSIKYILKALLLYKKLDDKKRVVQMYTYLANRYQQLGDNKKALKYLIIALKKVKKIKKLGFIHSRVFYNYRLYYNRLNNYREALKYINMEIDVLQNLNNDNYKYTLFALYTEKAGILIELGDFKSAVIYMNKFVTFTTKIKKKKKVFLKLIMIFINVKLN